MITKTLPHGLDRGSQSELGGPRLPRQLGLATVARNARWAFVGSALLLMPIGGCAGASPRTTSVGTKMPVTADSAGEITTPMAPDVPSLTEYSAPSEQRLGVLAPGTGIAVGKKVPDVHARDVDGDDVTLASLYAKGPILLAFYRGGWCPFCNAEVRAFTVAYPDFQRRGVTPVAVSVDRIEADAKLRTTYDIPFPILSDTDAQIIDAFRVAKTVEGADLESMRSHDIDPSAYLDRAHHEIAIPALFLIDRSGVVLWAHSDRDFTVRPSMTQILAAIDATRTSGT